MMLPEDPSDRQVVDNCPPKNWVNPEPEGKYNLGGGAGTAGLVSAAGAAGLGARVTLVEQSFLGGDYLNVGCVPSKGITRASRAAYDLGAGKDFGVLSDSASVVDFAQAMARMRRLRAHIGHHNSVHRFKDLGIDVYLGKASFAGPARVEVNGAVLDFGRAVIATGARTLEPDIAGLTEGSYFTNEDIFPLTDRPRRIVVIGGCPIGCELAQPFQRLSSEVSLLTHGSCILPKEDQEAGEIVHRHMKRDGVKVLVKTELTRLESRGGEKNLTFVLDGREEQFLCDALPVGAGRSPNVEGLGLEAAGVNSSPQGVEVDDRLRTSNPRIYAAGNVCSRFKFTHTADTMACIVLANALVIPWYTYTDPEIAHVGHYESDALAANLDVGTITEYLKDNDRALLDGEEDGFARIHYDRKSGKILGETIVARHVGEMIGEITLAMATGQKMGTLSSVIHPYSTQAEVLKEIGDHYMHQRLMLTLKRIFAWLFSLKR